MLVPEIIPPQNFAAGCSLYPSQSHQNCLTSMKIAFREWLMMFWEELVIIISPECVMKLWSWCVTQSPVSWPWPGVRPSASAWAGGEWREYKTISPPWPEYSLTPILHTNWTGTRLATSNDYAISYHCLDSNHSDESRLPKISRDKILWSFGRDFMLTNFQLWEFPWVYLVYMTQWQFAFLPEDHKKSKQCKSIK